MPKPPQSKTEWKDQYTLLCESCGYILEELDPEGDCPECGLTIQKSQPAVRRTFEWKGCTKFTHLIEMAKQTLRKPRWLLEHTQIDEDLSADLRSYWVLIAVTIFALMSALSETISSEWYQGLIVFPFAMFQVWLQIAIYSWLGRILFVYIANKRGKRMHGDLSKTIFNYACIGWIFASLGGVVAAPAIGLAELNGWTTTLRIINGIGIAILFLGIGYIVFFVYLGYKYAGYANQIRKPSQ